MVKEASSQSAETHVQVVQHGLMQEQTVGEASSQDAETHVQLVQVAQHGQVTRELHACLCCCGTAGC